MEERSLTTLWLPPECCSKWVDKQLVTRTFDPVSPGQEGVILLPEDHQLDIKKSVTSIYRYKKKRQNYITLDPAEFPKEKDALKKFTPKRAHCLQKLRFKFSKLALLLRMDDELMFQCQFTAMNYWPTEQLKDELFPKPPNTRTVTVTDDKIALPRPLFVDLQNEIWDNRFLGHRSIISNNRQNIKDLCDDLLTLRVHFNLWFDLEDVRIDFDTYIPPPLPPSEADDDGMENGFEMNESSSSSSPTVKRGSAPRRKTFQPRNQDGNDSIGYPKVEDPTYGDWPVAEEGRSSEDTNRALMVGPRMAAKIANKMKKLQPYYHPIKLSRNRRFGQRTTKFADIWRDSYTAVESLYYFPQYMAQTKRSAKLNNIEKLQKLIQAGTWVGLISLLPKMAKQKMSHRCKYVIALRMLQLLKMEGFYKHVWPIILDLGFSRAEIMGCSVFPGVVVRQSKRV